MPAYAWFLLCQFIIIIIIYSTPALADVFPRESDSPKVSSSLQDSS